jgi:NTE family protein
VAAASGSRSADVLLEGGGVKGIALVGAVLELSRHGFRFERVGGTSAGAMVGSVIVALERAGEPLQRLDDVARTLDYGRLRDRGLFGRVLGPLGFLATGLALALESGIYEGAYLHDWLAGVLRDLGVEKFGDLRLDDPGAALPPQRRYALVVTASDVSAQRFVRLPWDYPLYGLDADDQHVADAVRASASIPFFFEPVTMKGGRGVSTLVDGSLLSTYPVDLFDRADGQPPRWPTIGVRLSSKLGERGSAQPVKGPVSLALALVETALEACQAAHVSNAGDLGRSIFVDTSGVAATDFGITLEQQELLLARGHAAASTFLERWDFDSWQRQFRREAL